MQYCIYCIQYSETVCSICELSDVDKKLGFSLNFSKGICWEYLMLII